MKYKNTYVVGTADTHMLQHLRFNRLQHIHSVELCKLGDEHLSSGKYTKKKQNLSELITIVEVLCW